MEEASIKDRRIVIDTTKQRVIDSDDISYAIVTVDEVTVIRNDDQTSEENSFSVKIIWEKIESFLKK